MNIFKTVVPVCLGLIATVAVGGIETHLMLSESVPQNVAGTVVIMAGIGGFIITGVGLLFKVGKAISTFMFGGF